MQKSAANTRFAWKRFGSCVRSAELSDGMLKLFHPCDTTAIDFSERLR